MTTEGPKHFQWPWTNSLPIPFVMLRVMGALFPDKIPKTIRDKITKVGTTEDETRELLRKLQSQSH
jgi:hypothetical protein